MGRKQFFFFCSSISFLFCASILLVWWKHNSYSFLSWGQVWGAQLCNTQVWLGWIRIKLNVCFLKCPFSPSLSFLESHITEIHDCISLPYIENIYRRHCLEADIPVPESYNLPQLSWAIFPVLAIEAVLWMYQLGFGTLKSVLCILIHCEFLWWSLLRKQTSLMRVRATLTCGNLDCNWELYWFRKSVVEGSPLGSMISPVQIVGINFLPLNRF